MKYACTIAAASALFSYVSAHGGILEYSFDGEVYVGYDPGRSTIKRRMLDWLRPRASALIQREWDSYDPQTEIGGVGTICNDPGSPATAYATIAAGGTVSACFNTPWPHNSGPLTVYMAACTDGDCTTITEADLADLQWFAIYKEGLIDGTWATELYMEENSNCVTHIIPETLVAGNYLIRHETINLAKVEFYANCANVAVTGSGTETPSADFLATIAEIYVDGDASLVAIDSTPDSYTIPGPNVWPADTAEGGQIFATTGDKNACSGQGQSSGTCEDGGSVTTLGAIPDPTATGSTASTASDSSSSDDSSDSDSSAVTSAAAAEQTTMATSAKTTTTNKSSKATTTAAASESTSTSDSDSSDSAKSKAATTVAATSEDTTTTSGTVEAYGQCGGENFTAAGCVDGYTCTVSNDWYSQCVPTTK